MQWFHPILYSYLKQVWDYLKQVWDYLKQGLLFTGEKKNKNHSTDLKKKD